MANKCFCHLTMNGESYEVKDAQAREQVKNLTKVVESLHSWTFIDNLTFSLSQLEYEDENGATYYGEYGAYIADTVLAGRIKQGDVIKLVVKSPTLTKFFQTHLEMSCGSPDNGHNKYLFEDCDNYSTGEFAEIIFYVDCLDALWVMSNIYGERGEAMISVYKKG